MGRELIGEDQPQPAITIITGQARVRAVSWDGRTVYVTVALTALEQQTLTRVELIRVARERAKRACIDIAGKL